MYSNEKSTKSRSPIENWTSLWIFCLFLSPACTHTHTQPLSRTRIDDPRVHFIIQSFWLLGDGYSPIQLKYRYNSIDMVRNKSLFSHYSSCGVIKYVHNAFTCRNFRCYSLQWCMLHDIHECWQRALARAHTITMNSSHRTHSLARSFAHIPWYGKPVNIYVRMGKNKEENASNTNRNGT